MRLLLIGCIFCAVIFYSCGECSKTIDCPGFADTLLLQWFPYADSSIQTFTAGAQTKSFTIRNVQTSMPCQTNTGPYGGSSDCHTNKTFYSNERNTANNLQFILELQTQQPAFSGDVTRSGRLYITGNRVELTDLKPEGFSAATINDISAQTNFSQQLLIGNRIFHDVQKISLDTSSGKINGMYELYLSKGTGVVAYHIYPDTLWMRN